MIRFAQRRLLVAGITFLSTLCVGAKTTAPLASASITLNSPHYQRVRYLYVQPASAMTHNDIPPAQVMEASSPVRFVNPAPRAVAVRQRWTIRGAMAVKRGDKGWTAQVRWRQVGRRYEMMFSGPLGAASTQLKGQPGAVTLRTGQKRMLRASTPEALLKKAWGWTLPVSNLYYWIQGLPAPGVRAQVQRDRQQRIQHLRQQGWQIHFQRYITDRGRPVPTKLTLQRPGMRLRIVVRTWG